jgi:hypothetical protein
VKDWKKPAAGEHPRLLFRKSDLPEIRKRAETPEGKAILKRLRLLLDGKNGNTLLPPGQPEHTVGAFTLGHAAGYGLLYQLTGEKKYADLGLQCFERMLKGEADRDACYSFTNPNGELRAGWSWAVAALGYDLCYDGRGEADRKRIARASLDVKANQGFNLEKVVRKPKYRPAKNHTGGIMCGAVAAAALAGDPGTEGAKICTTAATGQTRSGSRPTRATPALISASFMIGPFRRRWNLVGIGEVTYKTRRGPDKYFAAIRFRSVRPGDATGRQPERWVRQDQFPPDGTNSEPTYRETRDRVHSTSE